MIKNIIYRTLWVLVFVFAIGLLVWSNMKYNNSHCTDIVVKMPVSNYPSLISEEDIKTSILKEMPAIIGQPLEQINLEDLETFVAMNAQLKQVKTFININGEIQINANARKAILRVFDTKGQNVYLGEGLCLMENSPKHAQRILVASGHIPHLTKSEQKQVLLGNQDLPQIYNDLYKLGNLLQEDPFLESLIDQIYVFKNGEIELTPKVGVKKIYFGKMEQSEEKLFKLKAFYLSGKGIVDWQKYQSINIKYSKQIVCSKK
ncbi:MAG: hypothetical protein B7C24_02645 [Bacteroidetes bacterium 4572_77]|nr:MAG: hypothetical protein B7C24_02645 [Bacteroidetes bacterium 4572_77]